MNCIALAVRAVASLLLLAAGLAAAPFNPGHILISARFGPDIKVYSEGGALLQDIPAATPHWGLQFGPGGYLYVAAGTDVLRFDADGKFTGSFASGFAGPVTDLDFDSAGNAYLGGIVNASESWLAKFSPAGVLIDEVIFPAEEGPVYVELSSDEQRLYNVSPAGGIRVFDVSTGMFLANIPGTSNAGPGDLHELPDGGLLFAGNSGIGRLNSVGTLIQTYDFLGSEPWRGLDLALDSRSFWAVDDFGRVRRFDLASDAILASFSAGLGAPYSSLAVAPVPEPSSGLLFTLGLVGLGVMLRRL